VKKIAIVLLLSLPAIAHADSLEEIFARGNAAYFRGDYEVAAREYRALMSAGVVDPDVTYNLAATEARRENYGAAIQLFERTLVLRPGDEEAEQALESVRDLLGRRRAEGRGEAEVESGPPLGQALFGSVSADTLGALALSFDLLLFIALAALLFAQHENKRLALGIAAVVTAIGLCVSGAGLAVQSGWLDEGDPAVVLADRAPLREGPDAHASERHHALEGQRAWVLDTDRGWSLVRVPSVGEGWVAPGEIGLIRP
jgi:tetratricopeptide (TPR) repeat protein